LRIRTAPAQAEQEEKIRFRLDGLPLLQDAGLLVELPEVTGEGLEPVAPGIEIETGQEVYRQERGVIPDAD